MRRPREALSLLSVRVNAGVLLTHYLRLGIDSPPGGLCQAEWRRVEHEAGEAATPLYVPALKFLVQ